MKQPLINRFLALSLSIATTLSLVGCDAVPSAEIPEATSTTAPIISTIEAIPVTSLSSSETIPTDTEPIDSTVEAIPVTSLPSSETIPADTEPIATTLPETEPAYSELTQQQKNSFSMLYYLAITAEEIRISKNNRLILDNIYTSLLNDINPGAIDETTQEHLQNLRDIIKSYMDISVKRDRLQYLYNQDKASAIRSAIPNPLSVLTMSNSTDWKKLAAATVFTVADSIRNYKNTSDAADLRFLTEGWELDDEESATILRNRERAFDYMVDIVQQYHLDGKMTLNERDIETFAEICSITSTQEKIHRLESEEDTFGLFGNYWLELADAYYDAQEYAKCIESIQKYNDLSTGIYRTDYNYVKVLPKVIVAAQTVYEGEAYVEHIGKFLQDLLENTHTTDWDLRYFAAQINLDLYNKTHDQIYLKNAYEIALDNVTVLLNKQLTINQTYMQDVVPLEPTAPNYDFLTDEEKDAAEEKFEKEEERMEAYNEALIEKRKTELPPLYGPLQINCDLLFALAKKLQISDAQKAEIEAILQTDNRGIFLTIPTNRHYSFSPCKNLPVKLEKDRILIPVEMLPHDSNISITITDNGTQTVINDCIIEKVTREDSKLSSFQVEITSDQLENYSWTAHSRAVVSIQTSASEDPISYSFKVSEFSDRWIISDKVVFESA